MTYWHYTYMQRDSRGTSFGYGLHMSSRDEFDFLDFHRKYPDQALLSVHMPFNADREEMKILSDTADFRIRKLTEREVFRLMDVSEEDIDRIQKAGISRSQQYKMAGNSIVVACLYHIFRKLFVDRGPEDGQLSLF